MIIRKMKDLEPYMDDLLDAYLRNNTYEKQIELAYNLGTLLIQYSWMTDPFLSVEKTDGASNPEWKIELDITHKNKKELSLELWLEINKKLKTIGDQESILSFLGKEIKNQNIVKRVVAGQSFLYCYTNNGIIKVLIKDKTEDDITFEFIFDKKLVGEKKILQTFNIPNVFILFTSFISFLKIALIKYDM
jgi:hypothetical protein